MKFYTFRQNNSGGSFNITDDLAQFVIIEAPNARLANSIAKELGIYFDGCDIGMDCECCGDRWHSVDEDDAEDSPCLYGEPIENYVSWSDGDKCIVHYLESRKTIDLKS